MLQLWKVTLKSAQYFSSYKVDPGGPVVIILATWAAREVTLSEEPVT